MAITASIVADSVSAIGVRLTTFQLRYPRFIHAEFMTHRQFSRNASSSRAIPVSKLAADIRSEPAMPISWGSNKPGMQAGDECNAPILSPFTGQWLTREEAWRAAAATGAAWSLAFAEAGYHKQVSNRLSENMGHINVVVTATEWDNFYKLRCHPDAQPEINRLACLMRDAQIAGEPTQLDDHHWHLPYVDLDDPEWDWSDPKTLEDAKLVSAARCARVSYLTHDGRLTTIAEDMELADRLSSSGHWSPFEHQARPSGKDFPFRNANLQGWVSQRTLLEF